MVIKKIRDHGARVIGKTKEHGTKVVGRARGQVVILQNEVRSHVATAIGAAFAFIIALVWRDAIRNILNSFVVKLGLPETAYIHEIVVALLITFVAVIGILVVARYSIKKK